jgi:hypothetical protein
MFLLAHVGHYMWAIYVPPFLIVGVAIVRSVAEQRRIKREEGGGAEGAPSSRA